MCGKKKKHMEDHTEDVKAWYCITMVLKKKEISAVSGFKEGVVVFLVNCRMWLVSDRRGVLMGSCFEKLYPWEIVIRSLDNLECIDKFYYLAGRGAEETSRVRVWCAWAKFKELAQVLTSGGVSLTGK